MTLRHYYLSLLTFLSWQVIALAQPMQPTPLLPIRFAGPEGLHATFYQNRPEGRTFDAPVTVGMRTGYIYRVKLSGMKKYPGVDLYPSLEVRGCLQLPPRINPAEYPAPVVLTGNDIEQALNGVLITKVVYLENPNRAASLTWRTDQPLESTLPANQDPWKEAWEFGRPVLIVRIGERQLSPEELAATSFAGTILHPDERVLMPPSVPPCLPLSTPLFVDPRLGPKLPEEECLHDGGDKGQPAGIDAQGRLHGLDPEDAVAEYTDSKGRRAIACSNPICICVPRYAVLKVEQGLARTDVAQGVGDTRSIQGHVLIDTRLPSVLAQQYEQMQTIRGRERPSATFNMERVGRIARVEVLHADQVILGVALTFDRLSIQKLTEEQRVQVRRQIEFARQLSQREGTSVTTSKIGTSVIGRYVGGPEVISAEVETRDFTLYCNQPEVQAPDKPLCLYKWADRCAAQVGDVVTIFLRYSNHGNKPITDIAVSDSLTGRLEYLPGTAGADRDAVFTMQPNEAGSLILRWEIDGTLQPGQSGVVRFQARVR